MPSSVARRQHLKPAVMSRVRQAQDASRPDFVGPPTQEAPPPAPALVQLPAADVARADHHVVVAASVRAWSGSPRAGARSRHPSGHEVGAVRPAPGRNRRRRRGRGLPLPRDAARATTPGKRSAQAVRHLAGAVGRVVVHDKHRQAGHAERMQLGDQSRQILGFVIGGDDDDGSGGFGARRLCAAKAFWRFYHAGQAKVNLSRRLRCLRL